MSIIQLKDLSILSISKAIYNYIYDDLIKDKYNIKNGFKNLVIEFTKKSKNEINLEDIYLFLKFCNIQSYNCYHCNLTEFRYLNDKIDNFIIDNSFDFAFTRIAPKFDIVDKNNLIHHIKKIQCYIYNLYIFSNYTDQLKIILYHLLEFYSLEYIKSLKEYKEVEWG